MYGTTSRSLFLFWSRGCMTAPFESAVQDCMSEDPQRQSLWHTGPCPCQTVSPSSGIDRVSMPAAVRSNNHVHQQARLNCFVADHFGKWCPFRVSVFSVFFFSIEDLILRTNDFSKCFRSFAKRVYMLTIYSSIRFCRALFYLWKVTKFKLEIRLVRMQWSTCLWNWFICSSWQLRFFHIWQCKLIRRNNWKLKIIQHYNLKLIILFK